MTRGMMGRVLVFAALVLLAFLAVGWAQPTPNRAGVVVQFGDGRVEQACVDFVENEITGIDLLNRAGIEYVAQSTGMGAAVCQIENEGCAYPADDCFCQCQGASCVFWRLYTARDNAWALANIGASSTKVRDGDVQAWVWGGGTLSQGEAPEGITPADVCAVPTATLPAQTIITPLDATSTATFGLPTTPPRPSATARQKVPTTLPTPPIASSITSLPVAGGDAATPDVAQPGQSALLDWLVFVGACVLLLALIVMLRRR